MMTQMNDFEETEAASISGRLLEQMDSSETTVRRHDEFFFEVASLGPGDLLSRCREGPGNWWGEEECLRVDEQGHVVLMDSTVYFQHYYTQRSLVHIAASACFSVLSGRALGSACALTPSLVEHLSKTWHRPRRPVTGTLSSEDASSSEGGPSKRGPGALAVALGQHVATVPLQPWTDEAAILAPLQCLPSAKDKGRGSGEDSTNLHGQLIAWSEDGRVFAVSLPTGEIVCLSNSPDRRGACLTSVPPYGGHRNGSPGNLVAGGGVAGLALRGSEERMEVLVLTFDAALVVYSFSPSEAPGQKASLVCEKRLSRWHASTSAMSFHAYTDTVAIVGPSGASRSAAAVSLTIWRVRGGAISRTDASSRRRSSSSFPLGLKTNASTGGVRPRTATAMRTSNSAGATSAVGSQSEETQRERHGDQRLKWSGAEGGTGGAKRSEKLRWSRSGNTNPSGGRVADKDESIPSFSALHCITLEGGSLVVPAPREGLDRGPSGALPALLPLVFPGLRAVSPPVQLEFNPSGDRLAVLDLGGGVTVVETSSVTARVSPLGRRSVAADGRSWRGGKGRARGPSVPSTKMEDAEREDVGTSAGSGAGVPRVVSVGWWSERTLAGVLSTGALAFMDTAAAAARGLDLLGEESTTTAFPRMSASGAVGWTESSSAPRPKPPVLGPRCTVWFAGDGRRAAVCWPGSGSGGGRWRGGPGDMSRRGGGGAAIGLLSLASAEEIVDGRIGRGLLSEALALAVACGVDTGRVRGALWREAIDAGAFSVDDVRENLSGASNSWWVIHEVLSSIGLSNSQEASVALLEEGFRRCELLEGRRERLRHDAGNAPASMSSGDAVDGGSSGAIERALVPSSTQAVDGWGDDDLDIDIEDDQEGPPGEQGRVTQGGETEERPEGVSQGGSGMAGASVGGSGGVDGDDGDDAGRSTRKVRKRLVILQNLIETNSMAETAQNRGFDAVRLREFLMIGSSTDPGVNSRTDTSMWSKAVFQRELLQTAVMKYARAGEVSAVGVLFGRHPVETLPIRLKVLSALPETLDPESYARLLPCGNPTPLAREVPSVAFERAGEEQRELPYAPPHPSLFFFMEGTPGNGQIESFGTHDHAGQRTEPLLTVDEMSRGGDHIGRDGRGDDDAKEQSGVRYILTAAEEQRSEGTLATWYLQRAKEIDSRGGQLRHALALCELGAVRVGAGRSDGSFSHAAAVGELLQLRTLLRQLTSLVYSGSVKASMALSSWERMGLEEKLTEVLQNSSMETIASDVRTFTQTAPGSSSTREQASPLGLESVLVRVLGNIVRASPSAETMEACAAVAKGSRPEVPESERLIHSPEALLTLLLESCYAWTATAPDRRAMEAAWELLESVPTRSDDVDASLQDRVDALERHLYSTQVLDGYGLAPPLTKYLEMGGGAHGSDRDLKRYTLFAREIVDQMCAVAMERAGLVGEGFLGGSVGGSGEGGGSAGGGVRGMLRRSGKLIRRVGGVSGRSERRQGAENLATDSASRECIIQLHKDVARLQSNTWQELGDRWAVRRVLQAVVEAGQFDVARALVESSTQAEEPAGGERGKGGSSLQGSESEAIRLARREMAEDVLLSAAVAHFNAAPSFGGGEELEASKLWLDLMPWTSPDLERERRLHEAGELVYDLGATDFVPLQLRLKLDGCEAVSDGSRRATSGAMDVVQEVLKSNPHAYASSLEEDASRTLDGGVSALIEEGREAGRHTLLGGSERHGRSTPGMGLVRLAGLLGLDSTPEVDRVRALAARAALDNGDVLAACDVMSAAVLERPPRRPAVAGGNQGHEEEDRHAFAPELCDVLQEVLGRGCDAGNRGGKAIMDRASDLCAVTLSRCSSSQISQFLELWSRFEALRFLSPPISEMGRAAAVGSVGADPRDEMVAECLSKVDEGGDADTAGDGHPEAEGKGSGFVVAGDKDVDRLMQALVKRGPDALSLTHLERWVDRALGPGDTGKISDNGNAGSGNNQEFDLLQDLGGSASPADLSRRREESASRRTVQGILRLLMSRDWEMIVEAAEAEEHNVCPTNTPVDISAAQRMSLILDRLCVHLARLELQSQEVPPLDDLSLEVLAKPGGVGKPSVVRLALDAGEEFGVGSVACGVGYALSASDGRVVLQTLKALLEEAESSVKELRASREGNDASRGGRQDREGGVREAPDPDEALVSALHKRGVSLNRARRACVATRNTSYKAALAWCVEHAGDSSMDAPLPARFRTPRRGSHQQTDDAVEGGQSSRSDVVAEASVGYVGRSEAARRAQRTASRALETYVRARLPVMPGTRADGGDERGNRGNAVPPSAAAGDEVEELVSVLSSFKERANLGEAEDRARGLLSPGVDLARFSEDRAYRQVELERAAVAGLISGGGEVAGRIVALGREYPGTDIWGIAAAAVTSLLSSGYANLRVKGLSSASASAKVESELRGPRDDTVLPETVRDDAPTIRGEARLLRVLLSEGDEAGRGLLQLVRGVFVDSADGAELHHLDLLLRLMAEGAAAISVAGKVAGGDGGGESIGSGGKNALDRRIHAHCGLIRRLLKVAPPGLDFKNLVGKDPLEDLLVDPGAEGDSGRTSASKPSTKGSARTRERVMAELRSVIDFEHVTALSKLATRVPELNASAVYLATAQRVLCGETGGLSHEALALLRGAGDSAPVGDEAEAASASVYHLVAPLLRKMSPQDLFEAVCAACSPLSVAEKGSGFPFREVSIGDRALGSQGSVSPFTERMQPLRLTLRSRRRILDEGMSSLAEVKRSAGGASDVTNASSLTVEQRFMRLRALLVAFDAAATAGVGFRRFGDALALSLAGALGRSSSNVDASPEGDELHKPTRPELAAVEGLEEMLLVGTAPSAIESACSSMREALGLPAVNPTEGVEPGRQGVDPSDSVLVTAKVYERAVFGVLNRLVRGNPERRAVALGDLHKMVMAVRPGSSEAQLDSTELTAISQTAWGVVSRVLSQFCDTGGELDRIGIEESALAPAIVLWARGEVSTLLRSFSEVGDSVSMLVNNDGSLGVVDAGRQDSSVPPGSGAEGLDVAGIEARNSSDGSGLSRAFLPARPSVPLLRVAEISMEVFKVRVAPEDVDSWEARSALMEKLVSAYSSGVLPGDGKGEENSAQSRGEAFRLQTLADVLTIWEVEGADEVPPAEVVSREASLVGVLVSSGAVTTAVKRVERMRTEVTTRFLLEYPTGEATPGSRKSGCGGRDEKWRTASDEAPQGEAASLVMFMGRWWRRLLELAMENNHWEFVLRSFVVGSCAAFTREEFEEVLWSTIQEHGAPPVVLVKIGLASVHPSRHHAAWTLMTSEGSAEGSGIKMDEEAMHLALSSTALPRLVKTSLYPYLVTLVLKERYGGVPRTSTSEFLMVAMSCIGEHGRAAALACEASGIHPGLRSLSAGVTVLERRLRQRRGWGATRGGEAGDGDQTEWFAACMERLRDKAWLVFEADVLN